MEIFHLLNRGVDGRDIFLDNSDRAHFVHYLYAFNDAAPAIHAPRPMPDIPDFVSRDSRPDLRSRICDRDTLVDLHGWCIMKNHYHLLLSERTENGITKFLRKLNIGYAKSFNEKYKRVGTLFQGRTKKIHIERDAQSLYILHYLHLNPLDYLPGATDWRVRSHGSIASARGALAHLNDYRWSSYLDYTGKKNFPSILTKDFFTDLHGNYADSLARYLHDAQSADLDVGLRKSLILE